METTICYLVTENLFILDPEDVITCFCNINSIIIIIIIIINIYFLIKHFIMLKKNSDSNENLTCHFVFKNLEKNTVNVLV